tara:strand:+ start:4829 stop:5290 length:462 start_codon:yes stop_codon:yes gene_type:complete
MDQVKYKYQGKLNGATINFLKLGIALYLILLFAYTGFSKLLDTDVLFTTLRNAPLFLTKQTAEILSWFIPLTEIGIAATIIFEDFRKIGLLSSIILLALFTAYTLWIVFVSPHQPCTCGGILSLFTWKQHLLLNSISLVLASGGLYLENNHKK